MIKREFAWRYKGMGLGGKVVINGLKVMSL